MGGVCGCFFVFFFFFFGFVLGVVGLLGRDLWAAGVFCVTTLDIMCGVEIKRTSPGDRSREGSQRKSTLRYQRVSFLDGCRMLPSQRFYSTGKCWNESNKNRRT